MAITAKSASRAPQSARTKPAKPSNTTNDEWDLKMERDAAAGKLDWLMEEALQEHRAGKTRPLPT